MKQQAYTRNISYINIGNRNEYGQDFNDWSAIYENSENRKPQEIQIDNFRKYKECNTFL